MRVTTARLSGREGGNIHPTKKTKITEEIYAAGPGTVWGHLRQDLGNKRREKAKGGT